MKRLFIATPIIKLSPEISNIVADLRYKMRHDNIVWVNDEVTHLTLRFLGATPPQQVPQIKKALDAACQNQQPIKLKINKIGAFGSKYQPKVIWLGFNDFGDFKELFNKLEPELLKIGIEPNSGNFVPHITLGRVKNVISKQKFWKFMDEIESIYFSQEIEISKIILYQSFLHNSGPEYKVLYEKNFFDAARPTHGAL